MAAMLLGSLGCETSSTKGTNGTPTPTAATPAPAPTTAVSLPPLKPETLTANRANGLRAAADIITHYTHVLQNPSATIHAVRAFGKDFKMADGRNAVDWLCANFAAETQVSGNRYVIFQPQAEVHFNSFLKAFLEAGVSPAQQILANGNKYTLKIFGDHAKLIFRCDPQNFARFMPKFYHEHLPWCLIAFSILTPPANPTWRNLWNETIDLNAILDRAVANYAKECEGVSDAVAAGKNEPELFRDAMRVHSCFGMHAVYGFFSCLKHGYRSNNMEERLKEILDITIYRMEGDSLALEQEFNKAAEQKLPPDFAATLQKAGVTVSQLTEAFKVRGLIKLLGHALEAINYAMLHKLFTLTAEQKKRVQAGEQRLYENLVKLRATDLEPLRQVEPDSKFVSDIVIALSHAARAMKLLTPENPDLVALNTGR